MKIGNMRLKHARLLIILIVFINIILFYYSWKAFLWKAVYDVQSQLSSSLSSSSSSSLSSSSSSDNLNNKNHNNNDVNNNKLNQNDNNNSNNNKPTIKDKIKNQNKHLRKAITIVFRNFYSFENDLKSSIDSILEIIPNIHILVVQDTIPYPPILYENNVTAQQQQQQQQPQDNNVKFMSLGFDISKTAEDLSPLLSIKTKYVLFMPDSVRLNSKNILQKILRELNNIQNNLNNQNKNENLNNKNEINKIIIIPFSGNIKSFNSCCQINLDLPNWTIEYAAVNTSDKCDLYLQKHAIFVDISILRHMPDALSSPFPEMFYIQAKIANVKKSVFPNPLQDGKRLFTSYHTKQRRMDIRKKHFKDMYKKLQIKRIIRKSYKITSKTDMTKDIINPQHNLVLDTQFSSSNFSLPLIIETDLIGCERNTKSCIGTVYNMKPFYLYINKHTPPCCMDKLKSVFNHIIDEFENVGIRYWLDNLALKYAIETNQLSLDAYEIDISFNYFDLERSNSLKKSQQRPYSDSDGYYWIKATDGQYFRVQYSKINQIGINLLPFDINGNKVKPNGFYGWKAKEFSSEFLHPMSTVLFLGKNVMCPNNVREYLEYKNIL